MIASGLGAAAGAGGGATGATTAITSATGDTVFEIIPAGTKVYVGEVGSQGGVYVGGTQQIVVQQPWLNEGVQVINSSPLK